MKGTVVLTGAIGALTCLAAAYVADGHSGQALIAPVHVVREADASAVSDDAGIRFSCSGNAKRMASIRDQMQAYLAALAIPQSWVILRSSHGRLTYTLNTSPSDSSTLDFANRPGMNLRDAVVALPTGAGGEVRNVRTVSQKEIVLALLQHGRLTEFDCSVEALKEHVGIRQNIVAWAENIDWDWPNGGSAKWNTKYWHRGSPLATHSLHEAVANAFLDQRRYRIGCYTATKLVILQGVLDYYWRIRVDPYRTQAIEATLASDGDPLSGIEPAAMWFFEEGYNQMGDRQEGKLVTLQYAVAADNFVPGDWAYLLNTDSHSSKKTGYEGSNTIYLGRGRFDDYYMDHDGHYSLNEKVDEVYQWRHGVFSRSRDAKKIRPLSDRDLQALTKAPESGGLLERYRAVARIDLGSAGTLRAD